MKKAIRIAIADDHKIFRTFLSARIAQYSKGAIQVVHESENGAELLCRLGHDQPDLILLDLDMPVMNGLQTARYLNVLFPEIILVGLTTAGKVESADALYRFGVRSFVSRDLTVAEMIAEIFRTCDGRMGHKGVLMEDEQVVDPKVLPSMRSY
jgi:DNA-binding NarL/FixJ family response regulator